MEFPAVLRVFLIATFTQSCSVSSKESGLQLEGCVRLSPVLLFRGSGDSLGLWFNQKCFVLAVLRNIFHVAK